MNPGNEPYRLSFTSTSSLLPTFVRLANMTVENGYSLHLLTNEKVEIGKKSTNIRQLRELKLRLKTLTREELKMLAKGSLVDQKHMTLLAICKTYRFIFDFIIEVVRDKALIYDYEIRESDYKSFINRKLFDHPELERIKDSSKVKIKTVLFRIISEVGLIDNARSRLIQPVLLSNELQTIIVQENPELLKIFLKSDKEIAELTHVD